MGWVGLQPPAQADPTLLFYPDFALQYSPVTETRVPEKTAVYRRESGRSQRYHAWLPDISYNTESIAVQS